MMRPGALPLGQLLLLDLLVPPIGAVLWSYMARGWVATVQGGTVSERTKQRQKKEFWILLVATYLLMFGVTIYGILT